MQESSKYEITPETCDAAIVQEIYLQVGYKTAICVLLLNTGFEAVGHHSPVDPDNFNINTGKAAAREQAFKEVEKHLSAIEQWKKAVDDLNKSQAAANEEAKNMAGPADKSNDPWPSKNPAFTDKTT
jgi:Zn finger protein HypA/HybF involved in hydrogenase expression